MSQEETILYKVVLTVTRISNKVSMDVMKAIGIKMGNTYLVKSLEGNENIGMCDLPVWKAITKKNILNVNPTFNPSEIKVTTWCLEEQLSSAKELCNEAMELYVQKNVDRANELKDTFHKFRNTSK